MTEIQCLIKIKQYSNFNIRVCYTDHYDTYKAISRFYDGMGGGRFYELMGSLPCLAPPHLNIPYDLNVFGYYSVGECMSKTPKKKLQVVLQRVVDYRMRLAGPLRYLGCACYARMCSRVTTFTSQPRSRTLMMRRAGHMPFI